ncbi:MAG: hypothetical protein ACKVP0_07525 [Pirellulaceae bacterium]
MIAAGSTPQGGAPEDPLLEKLKLEVRYLGGQNEKLSFEINELKGEGAWVRRLNKLLPVITGLVAVAGFWFGIIQYLRAENASLEQRRDAEKASLTQRREAEKARVEQQKAADDVFRRELKRETAKPLWEKQLSLYIEATEKAATIATSKEPTRREAAEQRFWELYWGPLAAVEDIGLIKQDSAGIEAAMVKFGAELEKQHDMRDAEQLKRLSLKLAHAVRSAIAPTFDVEATDLDDLRNKPKVGNP